jgi:hypothetical protein
MPQQPRLTSGSESPAVEQIRGGTQVRVVIIKVIGWLLGILAVGFIVIVLRTPDLAKMTSFGILQLIVTSVATLVGYVVGRRSNGRD